MKKVLLLFISVFVFVSCFVGCVQEEKENTVTENITVTVAEVTEEVSKESHTQEQKNDDWATAYKEYLLDICESDTDFGNFKAANFTLRYIDSDDIPELLINDGDFHASGVYIVTFVNGELVENEGVGSWGQISFVEKENRIITGFAGMSTAITDVYRLEKGLLVKTWTGEMSEGAPYLENTEKYSVNGVTVSKEKFESDYKKYADSQNETEAFDENAIRIDKEEIESFFKNL
ncbi:MAG: hypothetical protein IJB86_02685 [Clostridia bacterium]|nr:hypothetical protein [Clostridia bacterium]